MSATTRVARLVGCATAAGLAAAVLFAGPAGAASADPHKVWVCKYVDKPGVAEVLKDGKNPISVDYHSLRAASAQAAVSSAFDDGQFLSYGIGVDNGGTPPTIADCPGLPN
jgi:hypothetical protein